MFELSSLKLDETNEIEINKVETNDIAIIGISGKFPNSEDLNEFWENLKKGKDYIKSFPEKRKNDIKNYAEYMGIDKSGIRYREGAYINEIDEFDNEFFRLSIKEARLMDPNQRLFLQTAWNCIEDAGYGGEKITGTKTGVFVGYSSTSANEYREMSANMDSSTKPLSLVGNIPSIISSRISYLLDLRGPAMLIDTTCSSSLVAIHEACKSIKNKECELAIAGATKLMLAPLVISEEDKIGIESSVGRTRTFDDNSDGTGGGEGVIAILLKPLDKAIDDHDNIYAVIKGSAINQDGNSIGLTAPNPAAQEDVIVRAWQDAKIDPKTISYIEAHGTGTKLGDPIEIEGTQRAFRKYTDKRQFCGIGSIKTNIGHLDNASGIASLIKVTMALKNKEIPPTIHLRKPNSKINFLDSPVYITNKLKEWNGEFPRRAGINSFGLSGTNCHMVLEEAPKYNKQIDDVNRELILVLSAKSRESLKMLVNEYCKGEENQFQDSSLYNICYSASTGRSHYNYRIALIVKDHEDLKGKLLKLKENNLEVNDENVFFNYEIKDESISNEKVDINKSRIEEHDYLCDICEKYINGAKINWSKFYNDSKRRKVSLPGYQFKKTRCWLSVPKGHKFVINKQEKIDSAVEESNVKLYGRDDNQYSKIEKLTADAWHAILGTDEININSSLYELGADSIAALKIANMISSKLKVKIDISKVLNYETIKSFATEIEKDIETNALKKSLPEVKALNNKEYYETSPAQKRIYVLNNVNDKDTVYNLPSAVLIKGKFDKDKFEKTAQKLIENNEILRTSFHVINGEIVQKVNDNVQIEIQYSESVKDNIDYIIKSFVKPFNISTAPLIRMAVVKIDDSNHLFLTDMHHIISDGTTLGILIKQFTDFYNDCEISKSKIQYKEFSAWQNDIIKNGYMKDAEEYWLNLFEDEIPILNMPSSYVRSKIKSSQGRRIEEKISLELTEKLKELCEETQSTMYMILLSAYYVLLHKYTGDEDIVIGTPVSGRMKGEFDNIAGLFVNTIAMRNYPKKEESFNEFLNEVKNNSIKSFMYQDYPLDMLVDKLNLQRDTSRNPLFDTMFIMQNMKKEELYINGLKFEDYEIENNSVQFDITFSVIERDGRLNLSLDYCEKLFDESFMKYFINNYISILYKIIEDRDKKLCDIDILSEDQKEKVLISLNDSDAVYRRDLTISELFEIQAERYSNNIAVKFYEKELTYKELKTKADNLASILVKNDVKPNTVVALAFERSIETVISILGILKAGASFMYLDLNFPSERIQYMLDDAKPKVMLINNESKGKIKGFDGTIINIDDERLYNTCSEISVERSPEDRAYIIYTSGSTGVPKGVELKNRGVVNLANWQKENFNVTSESNISQFATYSFDGAIGETFMALLNGATLVMLDRKELSPGRILNSINENRINIVVLTPALITQLNPELIKYNDELTIISVGEECPIELAKKWSKYCRFANAYGPTEYTVYSHNWFFNNNNLENKKQLPIGNVMYNSKTYILDSNLNPVPEGVIGEMYLSGDGMAKGYLNKINKTIKSFIINPFNPMAERYFKEVEYKYDNVDYQIEHLESSTAREEISKEKLMNLIENYDSDIKKKTEHILENYDKNDPLYKCMIRYFLEGFKNNYKSYGIDEKLIRFILPFDDFKGLKGIDFGFGNGEVLKIFKNLGAQISGFDLSPSFVQSARNKGLDAYQVECDLENEEFKKQFNIESNSRDFVITNLTLDRLNDPVNFIKNFFSMLKEGGRFAIQSLLPIKCIDDENIDEPIVYTLEDKTITYGDTVNQDKMILVTLLRMLGGRDIKICSFPYYIATTNEVNKYECWSISGIYNPNTENYSQEDPFALMYKTGDLARYNSKGEIEFIGRADNMVKIRGFRIELGEIEAKLLKHENIKEALVVINAKSKNDKCICAYIVTDKKLSAKELREFLSGDLPDYMIPSDFVSIDKIPLNSSGKVDRKNLPSPVTNLEEKEIKNIKKPRNDIEAKIASAMCKVLGIDSMDIETNFFYAGGNSIKAIQLVSELEEEFSITVNDIFKYQSISEISKHVNMSNTDFEQKIEILKNSFKHDLKQESLSFDGDLEEYKKQIKLYDSKDINVSKNYKNILLAGSTGYLGSHVLKELLENTESNVTVLVRGNTSEKAKEKFIKKLSFYFEDDFYNKYDHRLVIVKGDITKENLGLDLFDYIKLSKKIDCVINCAANVNHYGNYDDFEDINVKGTERLVNFSITGREKDYNHMSTISIAAGKIKDKNNVIFTENDCDMGQEIDNYYVDSKLRSEKLLLEMREQGMNINIFRVGNLVFDSRNGKFQENITNNAFYSIVKSLVDIGCIPDSDYKIFDFSFIDYVSKAIVLLFNKEKLIGETYHVYNDNNVSLRELGEKIKEAGQDIEIKNAIEFLDYILQNRKNGRKKESIDRFIFHSQLLNLKDMTNFNVVCDKTKYLLNILGFKWDKITESHIIKMMNYCRKIGFM